MKSIRPMLAMALSLMLGVTPAYTQNVLPVVQGPGGPVMAQPLVNIGKDSGTGLACVVGFTPTCQLLTNASGSGGGAVTGAAGAFVDGWSVTGGLTTDAACVTDNGTCTFSALFKRWNQRETTLITAVGSPVQALAQGSTTSGQNGALILCAVSTAPPTDTTAQSYPLSCNVHGSGRFIPATPGGVDIDLSGPSGLIGADGVTIMSATNPLNTKPVAQANTVLLGTVGVLGADGATVASVSNPVNVLPKAQATSVTLGSTGLTDGTNVATVKAASTAPATTDTALVVAQSPNPAPSCPNIIAINQTTATDLHTFTNFGYICSIYISNATSTQAWSLVEGTGTMCATGITADIGGTTASVQGSMAMANWRTTIKMQASAKHLCLLQGSSTNISGFITYVDAS